MHAHAHQFLGTVDYNLKETQWLEFKRFLESRNRESNQTTTADSLATTPPQGCRLHSGNTVPSSSSNNPTNPPLFDFRSLRMSNWAADEIASTEKPSQAMPVTDSITSQRPLSSASKHHHQHSSSIRVLQHGHHHQSTNELHSPLWIATN